MPTILMVGPYRLYFYSHEPNEPPQIHVDWDEQSAKFWLDAVALAGNLGFSPANCGESIGSWKRNAIFYWRNGMSASQPNSGERVRDVHITEETLAVGRPTPLNQLAGGARAWA